MLSGATHASDIQEAAVVHWHMPRHNSRAANRNRQRASSPRDAGPTRITATATTSQVDALTQLNAHDHLILPHGVMLRGCA